ncbi:hypothetical protein NGB36_03775 [Streptomyces sp. RB6PN25]|uniref:Uncharacterized protein n=1 Tax=Streptomyces humicola TaxID=2953240 RepID=A0ABT1PS07_9ACTN|nr:hypothetical protein [Streptomyces humicola]
MTRAADDLIHGRLCPRLLHDLFLNTARLELGLEGAQCGHHDRLEAVVFPDVRAAFSLVGHRGGDLVGVTVCHVVAAVGVVDAVGG